ncbi:MAG: hypothetical protein HeimC3_06010 [Candidatus Heimdallarchaeota archaeon LC_3]|nr:MAG: hypothetical protein HeimC3_06010 [Candidatus Heimdallarchaeota archaeon LC_3]
MTKIKVREFYKKIILTQMDMTINTSFQRGDKSSPMEKNIRAIRNFPIKNISFFLFLLLVNINLISIDGSFDSDNSSIETFKRNFYLEERFLKSILKDSSVSTNYSSFDPPVIENSIFFVSEETGRLTEELFQNNNITISDHEENSLFSIIQTNLTSLQYDKRATGENISNNNFWFRSSDGLLGPKRLEGSVELDYTNVIEGKASTKFSVTTNTSLNWYSDYQLPGWIDNDIPSAFSHNSYISGAFQFNASRNLLDHQYGFNNWLRLIFDNDNYAINIIFNRSSGLIENISSFYRKTNQDFIINIVLGSNDGNQDVLTWKEGEWARFSVNLTGILNTIYPLSSSLRLEAEKAFSNLSLSILDLQSFAFENGVVEFRLDDFHWITTFSEKDEIDWEQNKKIFVDTKGNPLENSSNYGLEDFSWLTNSSQWNLWSTDKNFILKSPTSFSPFNPVWEYKKQTFYYYNQSWVDKIRPTEFFHLDLTYKIDSEGFFVTSDNTSTQIISQPLLLLSVLQYPTLADLPNIDVTFTLLRFHPFNESNSLEIIKESRYWKKQDHLVENIFENLQHSLINSTLLSNIKNNFVSSYFWELNKQKINEDNELLEGLSNSIFVEILLDDFPQIKESLIIPNLLFGRQTPIIKVFENGIQLELYISSENLISSFKFISEIVASDSKSILSHSIVLNEKTVIFIPWIKTPNNTEQITIKLYLLIQNIGIGWIEETFLFDNPNNPTALPLTTITIYSSTENNQLTNTSNNSNNLINSNNENSIIHRPNSIFNSESSSIALYGLMIIGPIFGSIIYFKRKQRSKLYNMIYDE